MQSDTIDFLNCAPGQVNDVLVAGKRGKDCQVFLGNSAYYTDVCNVPRRVSEASVLQVQKYCRNLSISPYLYELSSPSFPIAVFSTIILYFFLRYLIRTASQPKKKVSFSTADAWRLPSKKDLRFPRIP